MPGIILPTSLNVFVFLIGTASTVALFWILNRILLKPVLVALAERRSPPMKEGFTHEVILEDVQRVRNVSIGLLDADIKLRMQGVREDHLILRFHKELDLEEYDITIIPGGPVFFRAPHSRKMERIRTSEKFESHELIGHPAAVRIAAIVQHERPLQYLEFEIACEFFLNRSRNEKLKFLLRLKKIYPGIDLKSATKKGIYRFSRRKLEADRDQDAPEGEEEES